MTELYAVTQDPRERLPGAGDSTERVYTDAQVDFIQQWAYEMGYAAGREDAAADEARALVTMMWPGAASWKLAAERHERALARRERRGRADAGDPELLRQYADEATRHVSEMRAHGERHLREALSQPPQRHLRSVG